MSCSDLVRTTPGRPGRPLVRPTPDGPPPRAGRTTLVQTSRTTLPDLGRFKLSLTGRLRDPLTTDTPREDQP